MHKYLLTLSLLCSNFLLSQSSPYQCAEIKSPAERLACYDNLFARPDKQINIKKPIIKPNNNPKTGPKIINQHPKPEDKDPRENDVTLSQFHHIAGNSSGGMALYIYPLFENNDPIIYV